MNLVTEQCMNRGWEGSGSFLSLQGVNHQTSVMVTSRQQLDAQISMICNCFGCKGIYLFTREGD